MSFLAQITGHAAHSDPSEARDAEIALAEALREVAQKLTDLGHEGVAATFTGEHTGSVNLLAGSATEQPEPTGDALGGDTPQPPAEGETQPESHAVPDGTPVPPPADLGAAADAVAATPPAGGAGEGSSAGA